MKHASLLSCALTGLVLLVGGIPANAQERPETPERPEIQPTPEQLAERCVARIRNLTERTIDHNAETAKKAIVLINRLKEQGNDRAAAAIAKRSAQQVIRNTKVGKNLIRRTAAHCLRLLDGHPLSDTVKTAAKRGSDAIDASAQRALGAIRDAVGEPTPAES
ncbi:MAG: hypothetical protein RLN76_09210 [Phycisphaeraceae bacterium]